MSVLEGVSVVSFNHFLLGPLAAQFLADQGASVIMVESLQGGFQRAWATADVWVGGQSALHFCANRNKRSIAVDLKSKEGRAIVFELVKTAQVVMENFRPGVIDRLGFGYEVVKKENPGVVFASASGWGSSGPYANKPGQDLLAQAFSGLVHTCGAKRPTPVSSSIVDHHGATVMAAAILGALVKQARTGQGSRVEVDLLSAALDLQLEPLTAYMNKRGAETRPPGFTSGWHYPAPYGIYQTQDGYVAISLGPLADMADALQSKELLGYSEQDTWEKTAEISDIIEEKSKEFTTSEITERFEKARLWISPVNDYEAVANDPQVRYNETFDEVELAPGSPATLVRHPARYDGARPGTRRPPQALGAETVAILQEMEYSSEQIEDFLARRIVSGPPSANTKLQA